MIRKCKYCKKEFETKSNNQFYCSKECKLIVYNRKRRIKKHFRTDRCLYCGRELKNKNTSRRYCDNGICYKLFRCLKRRKPSIDIKTGEKTKLDVFFNELHIVYNKVGNQWSWKAYKFNKLMLSSDLFSTLNQAQKDCKKTLK